MENKRTRVAILTNYPADHQTFTGGVETATAALLEGLKAYQGDFEFDIVCSPHGLSKTIVEEKEGFHYIFLGVPNRPHLPFRVYKAFRLLRKLKPDLVHCQGNMALALATVFSGYRNLFTIHGILRDEANKRSGWEFWSAGVDALIERYVLKRFDAFVCISNYAHGIVGDGKPVFLIPNAVRRLFFQPPLSIGYKNTYLLFVGVIAPLKRPIDLILSHEELRREFGDLETIICGGIEDSRYADSLRELIDKREIKGVSFTGPVRQEKVQELIAGATALILPSTQENMPMVIAEAMALGKPVVATRVGGVGEMVVHGETGLLFEVGDIGELTNALRILLVDRSYCEKLGSNAQIWAEAVFSPSRVASDTVVAYRQLLKE